MKSRQASKCRGSSARTERPAAFRSSVTSCDCRRCSRRACRSSALGVLVEARFFLPLADDLGELLRFGRNIDFDALVERPQGRAVSFSIAFETKSL
jgi:hypothetical protein